MPEIWSGCSAMVMFYHEQISLLYSSSVKSAMSFIILQVPSSDRVTHSYVHSQRSLQFIKRFFRDSKDLNISIKNQCILCVNNYQYCARTCSLFDYDQLSRVTNMLSGLNLSTIEFHYKHLRIQMLCRIIYSSVGVSLRNLYCIQNKVYRQQLVT